MSKDQIKAIAAYLWQESFDGKVPDQARAMQTKGKELFETRGCLGCHSIGEGDSTMGGTFAANPSARRRKGELRIHRALDSQPARTLGALLSEREARPDAGRLRKHGKPLRFDTELHSTLSKRRRRVAGPEHDGDAELPSV